MVGNIKTAWEMEDRDWETDLKFGEHGQIIVNEALRKIPHVSKVDDIGHEKLSKKADIDTRVSFDHTNKQLTVEIKTDNKAYKTGNIPLERTSNGGPGCLWRCQADRVMFYIPQQHKILVFDTKELQQYMHQLEDNKVALRGMGQGARGWLVKICDLQQLGFVKSTIRLDRKNQFLRID